jgi:RNA methyltransferase, TrmH family
MISKNEVNFIKKLSNRQNRNEENVFVAEGEKLVLDLIQSNLELRKIYYTKATENQFLLGLKNGLVIDDSYMTRITQLKTHASCLAIFEKPAFKQEAYKKGNWIIALDGLQDPGNMGTIIRIADWFGIKEIICTKNTVDAFNQKAIQASMGSIARVNVNYIELEVFIKGLAETPIYATVLNGANILNFKNFEPGVIIIGNEGNGVSDGILQYANFKISLPCIGGAESLNAAVAASMVLTKMIY